MTQSIQKSAPECAATFPADRRNDALEAELSVSKLRLHGATRWYVIAATFAAILASVNQLFNMRLGNYTMLEGQYLYILAGLFLSVAFVCFRVDGKASADAPWYDWVLAAGSLIVAVYFAATAGESLDSGWEYAAPRQAVVFSVAFYALILEATRRAGGWVLFGIVATFSLYPTFAGSMPDPLSGFQSPFLDVVPYFMISSEASFGIPMNAFGNLVIGFVLFGAILQFTGGGKFFNNLALALVGQFRGGAAKVAIFASGFMGSMSGSVISNVLTTGAVSIPAMKRTGFSARYAAATEACASTGGVLMPPIMGATAFVMAAWLSRPYVDIMMAAAVPSILYYFGLFVQIDAYAARNGLRGLPRNGLPGLRETIRDGWQYVFVFAVLIFLMVAFRWETTAPFYAIVLLLVINQFSRRDRFSRSAFMDMVVSVGRTLAELTAIVLGIGIIVGSFQATGLTGPLATELIFMAGDNVFVLLIMGAITSFVFGMGMPVTACYIFLAVVLAPTLVQAGLNELAVHLFILYWGMVSFITPPVAIGAFGAASLAGASPMRTGVEAMRLGGVIYIVPFFFVMNPALIGEGPLSETAIVFVGALIGIWLISAALQGYVSFFGALPGGARGVALRVLLFAAGMLIAAPTGDAFGLLHLAVTGAGIALAILPLAVARRTRSHGPATEFAD
ncbi:TRAP transporter fused permease subunit [Sedimentitalea sp. JM2-8]|uniref:TRAP transporter fused permease subunit n=1 Tax=Sedimentitalea xiamensis TaxID=3050037 RepID=A0ABT7FHA3_9RHOB|nr:TRAP transporter fused permease subunit [Sedimentitalea xiamensis]MDK3074516.1 TRAP transporter fused permease subunit [Sedimentitalea xiamensis]